MRPQRVDDRELVLAVDRLSRGGVAPTYRELAEHLGYGSASSIRYRILSLEEKGLISRRANASRSVAVKGGRS